MDEEEGVLGLLEEHELPRPEAGDLPTEFRADTPTRARHQYYAVAQILTDHVELELHRLAAEQVLERHVANRRDAGRSRHHLEKARHHLRRDPGLLAKKRDAPNVLARRGGNGDERLLRTLRPGDLPEPGGRAENLEALDDL